MKKTRCGLDSTALRLLAILFMVLDHLWATVVPGNLWLTCLGRLAFPIFAFQLCEGYRHTSDYRRYRRRLLVFALLSEIPFNLFYAGSVIFPFHQNVLFTLLLGLLAIRQADRLRREEGIKKKSLRCLALLLIFAGGVVLFPDYGLMGVMTVLCFFVFRDHRLFQLAAMVVLNIFTFKGQTIPVSLFGLAYDFPIQGFALLALPLIWLYNGEKGRGGKGLRLFWYIFYPLHMLALYFIQRII
ncbi:MAG: TraX family protein [Candidatus Limivicinus sp.]|nr:TraX family protein [Candidatus Limivicinus sp.]